MLRREITVTLVVCLLCSMQAKGEEGAGAKLPRPGYWSVEKLKPTAKTAWRPEAPRRAVSWPKIITGLALIGAGAAMVAQAPPADHSRELRGGGTIPCIAITSPAGGGNASSRETTCHYEDVKSYSNLFKGGWFTIATGAAVTIWGVVPKSK